MESPVPVYLLTRQKLLELGVPEAVINNLFSINVDRKWLQNVYEEVVSPNFTERRSTNQLNSTEWKMADLSEPAFKKVKQDQEKPEESGMKLNDLPELPFEKILGYLILEDRIKSRAVSRRWRKTIDSFRPKSLCYSDRPSDFIFEKNRWVRGEFLQSCFISSPRFGTFFGTFSQTIFSSLKQLYFCRFDLNERNATIFARMCNSFGQLEEIGLFRVNCWSRLDLQLNMPMLKSATLENADASVGKLSLDASRLKKVKLSSYRFGSGIEMIHGKSVEKLIIDKLDAMEVKNLRKMKNLKYLYCGKGSRINSTLLSTLEQLNEIHLDSKDQVWSLFEQKERYGRSNLNIFLRGCLLNGPNDLAIGSLDYDDGRYLVTLIENQSRLAEEIPLRSDLSYSVIEAVAPDRVIGLLSRFTDLDRITADETVEDVDRFLKLSKNLKNVVQLDFDDDQPQQLFDRLPNHLPIKGLEIGNPPADFDFLFKLKSLVNLFFSFSIDIEFICRVLEELPFLSRFEFWYLDQQFEIDIDHLPKQFTVWLEVGKEKLQTRVSDVNAVVQWIKDQ